MAVAPFSDGIEAVRGLRGRRVCVLAGRATRFCTAWRATLSRHVLAEEMDIVPAPSPHSRLPPRGSAGRWPRSTPSRCTADPSRCWRPLLHPGRRVLALTSDAEGPPAIRGVCCARQWLSSVLRFTIPPPLEALGGQDERIRETRAEQLRYGVHPSSEPRGYRGGWRDAEAPILCPCVWPCRRSLRA